MPEQFTLQLGNTQAPAGEGFEGVPLSSAEAVNLFCDQLFSRAGLANHEQWIIGCARLDDAAKDLLDPWARTNQVVKANLGYVGTGTPVQRAVHLCLHIIDVQRADEYVTHPLVH